MSSPTSPEVTTPPPDGRPPEENASALAALGAETQTERAVKRIVPWVASVMVHLGLVLLGFLVSWTVIYLQRDREPALIVADFDRLVYEPVAHMNLEQAEVTEQIVQDRVRTESVRDRLDEAFDLPIDPVEMISDAAGEAAMARFSPDLTRATATFVGISSTNARRIVYVIDASGSMIRSLPIVIDELARSMDGLGPQQWFSVIFFQRNEAVVVPPAGKLIPALDEEKVRVLSWIDENVIPAGRSNPLSAIRKALALKPDVIFLLSENITGSGEFEIDQVDLLAMLDSENPIDSRTGRRPTQINCIQFLDPDPLETLRKIAEAHGGENGYKFLDREELGLRAP